MPNPNCEKCGGTGKAECGRLDFEDVPRAPTEDELAAWAAHESACAECSDDDRDRPCADGEVLLLAALPRTEHRCTRTKALRPCLDCEDYDLSPEEREAREAQSRRFWLSVTQANVEWHEARVKREGREKAEHEAWKARRAEKAARCDGCGAPRGDHNAGCPTLDWPERVVPEGCIGTTDVHQIAQRVVAEEE